MGPTLTGLQVRTRYKWIPVKASVNPRGDFTHAAWLDLSCLTLLLALLHPPTWPVIISYIYSGCSFFPFDLGALDLFLFLFFFCFWLFVCLFFCVSSSCTGQRLTMKKAVVWRLVQIVYTMGKSWGGSSISCSLKRHPFLKHFILLPQSSAQVFHGRAFRTSTPRMTPTWPLAASPAVPPSTPTSMTSIDTCCGTGMEVRTEARTQISAPDSHWPNTKNMLCKVNHIKFIITSLPQADPACTDTYMNLIFFLSVSGHNTVTSTTI